MEIVADNNKILRQNSIQEYTKYLTIMVLNLYSLNGIIDPTIRRSNGSTFFHISIND